MPLEYFLRLGIYLLTECWQGIPSQVFSLFLFSFVIFSVIGWYLRNEIIVTIIDKSWDKANKYQQLDISEPPSHYHD